jgi:hypothetical protein
MYINQRRKKMFEVTGKCSYANVIQPNFKFEPCWSIEIAVDDSNKKLIKESKLKTHHRPDEAVRFRKRFKNFNGKIQDPPLVLDDRGRSWKKGLIGNGSLVTVIADLYEWKYRNKKGIGADLYSVQILNHIPYPKEKEDV